MRFGKSGLSPVIASMFMILLVLAMSSLVFSWARGFVNDKGEEAAVSISANSLCNAVDLDIVVAEKNGDTYSFEAVNRGNVDISSLKFRIFPGGNSNIVDSAVMILAGSSVVNNVILTGIIDRIETLSVLDGKLVGSSDDIVCSNNPVDFK